MSAETRAQTFCQSKDNIGNDDDGKTVSAQINENSEQVLFSGFDSLYENMVALEDQILCKEFQDEADEKYEKIASRRHFNNFYEEWQGMSMTANQQNVAKSIAWFFHKKIMNVQPKFCVFKMLYKW